MNTPAIEGASDFDFFIGSWQVTHRRLKARLAGCTEWDEFPGTTVTGKLLGGFGNCDDNVLEYPGGRYCAATLRSFNPETGTWSIWWLDGRAPHTLDTPMIGSFENDRGVFYADDLFAGKTVRARFLWTLPSPDQPRWEQALSADGGKTWETNWTMEFRRKLPG